MGHFVTGIILKLNVKEIRVFFFGGVTVLEEDLNLCIYKEILLIIMGPVIQILFYLLIYIFYSNGYVSITTFNKVKLVNQILLGFNLLPILPLDGGKILILLIEVIRRKPMKLETEAKIQLIGLSILMALTIFVTYNDILRIGGRFLKKRKIARKLAILFIL